MKYEREAKKRFGITEAWREYEEKSSHRTPNDDDDIANGLMRIFESLGKLKEAPPEDAEVQAEIARLQKFITDNYYVCTDEILSGLGEMYSADARFKKNIDRSGGDGTAEFASKAIKAYCLKK